MNILTTPLITSLDVDGCKVPINWDFRPSLKFTAAIDDPDSTDEDITAAALNFYLETKELQLLNDGSLDTKKVLAGLIDFYSYNPSEHYKSEPAGSKKVVDYEADNAFIYSAFLEQYGIDLTEEKLHWWKFKALFESLSDRTYLSKIIEIRSADTKDMSTEQKRYYQRMKRIYKLGSRLSAEEEAENERLCRLLEGS